MTGKGLIIPVLEGYPADSNRSVIFLMTNYTYIGKRDACRKFSVVKTHLHKNGKSHWYVTYTDGKLRHSTLFIILYIFCKSCLLIAYSSIFWTYHRRANTRKRQGWRFCPEWRVKFFHSFGQQICLNSFRTSSYITLITLRYKIVDFKAKIITFPIKTVRNDDDPHVNLARWCACFDFSTCFAFYVVLIPYVGL